MHQLKLRSLTFIKVEKYSGHVEQKIQVAKQQCRDKAKFYTNFKYTSELNPSNNL